MQGAKSPRLHRVCRGPTGGRVKTLPPPTLYSASAANSLRSQRTEAPGIPENPCPWAWPGTGELHRTGTSPSGDLPPSSQAGSCIFSQQTPRKANSFRSQVCRPHFSQATLVTSACRLCTFIHHLAGSEIWGARWVLLLWQRR